jgi:hypothetical protein
MYAVVVRPKHQAWIFIIFRINYKCFKMCTPVLTSSVDRERLLCTFLIACAGTEHFHMARICSER